jgi:hypothetical protein
MKNPHNELAIMPHFEIKVSGCFDAKSKEAARQIAEDLMAKFNKLNHPHGRNFHCTKVEWSDELEVKPDEPPVADVHSELPSDSGSAQS